MQNARLLPWAWRLWLPSLSFRAWINVPSVPCSSSTTQSLEKGGKILNTSAIPTTTSSDVADEEQMVDKASNKEVHDGQSSSGAKDDCTLPVFCLTGLTEDVTTDTP